MTLQDLQKYDSEKQYSTSTICIFLDELYFETLHQNFLKFLVEHLGVMYDQAIVE